MVINDNLTEKYECGIMNTEYEYCDECYWLTPTEMEQEDNLINHFCRLLNKRVYHKGHHPFILRDEKCFDLGKVGVVFQ